MKVYSVDETIKEIIKMRFEEFKSVSSIAEVLMEKYGLSKQRCYTLIKQARIKAGELYNNTVENVFEDAIIKLENMLENAKNKNDGKLMLDIQKELNKVHQLYLERVDITTGGESLNIKDLLNFKDDKSK